MDTMHPPNSTETFLALCANMTFMNKTISIDLGSAAGASLTFGA